METVTQENHQTDELSDLATYPKIAQETGCSQAFFRAGVRDKKFIKGVHYFKPERRVFFSRKAIAAWIKNK